MSTILESPLTDETDAVDVPVERLWRVSVDQYHEMLNAGILRDGDPVELIDGLLVRKMSKNPPHVFALQTLHGLLARILVGSWILRLQDPITLAKGEPEPDLVVVRGGLQDYAERHPGPRDIGLAVEVAETSLADDRGYKRTLYAAHRIGVYWIVNVIDEQIEVYTEPAGRGNNAEYRVRRNYLRGESVPVILDGVQIGAVPVSELFAR